MPAPITANTIATSVIVVNSVCCGSWLGVEVGFWCGVSVGRDVFMKELALVSGDVKNGIKPLRLQIKETSTANNMPTMTVVATHTQDSRPNVGVSESVARLTVTW